jgi:gamma-glutamyltranspeptidase/glutathione hydrolase
MSVPRISRGPLVRAVTGVMALTVAVSQAPARASSAPAVEQERSAVAVGSGGAVATGETNATQVALDVLRAGGNAVDAAVAAAATLGVTEPFTSGIGGGGFFVFYDARTRTVHTLDGRETAPSSMRPDSFVNPATAAPYDFQEARVSGVSVGVPGTPLTWAQALDRWGTWPLRKALAPAVGVAERGFVVTPTFAGQISDNANAFGQFGSTSALYLPGGTAPAVGSVFRNPDLAKTYRLLARGGTEAFYRGGLADEIAHTVRNPPLAEHPSGVWNPPIRSGSMAPADLAGYGVRSPRPTHLNYRGLDVYGMSTPSSGGSTVGEALKILEGYDLASMDRTQALHLYLEASALAFADRNRYVGDGTPQPVLDELLSGGFAKERRCLINPASALAKPVAPGVPDGSYSTCAQAPVGQPNTPDQHTTNLTVADRWGNVVEYTLTIEQIGGNAMVVPGRGFLLNNELTDFNFVPTQGAAPDPNLPAAGKRPRSSMAPTIVLHSGRPYLATGTPGGSTIITTVLQILMNRLALGMTLPEAIAAPRATQRNTAAVQAEPAFLSAPETAGLTALGHAFTSTAEIGAATGVEFLPDGAVLAAAEPVRRGGGAAAVVSPRR